jgi:hypothetical protein
MSPFALPRKIEEELCPVHKHWRLLKRAGNEMPFWDDLKLNELSSFADRLMIIDVIERPERFRFNTVGNALAAHYGINPVGKFTNEIEPKPPFNYLTAQCSSTAESRAPTYYERKANKDSGEQAYARLLLPLWGEGSVRMLLGAIAFAKRASTLRRRK